MCQRNSLQENSKFNFSKSIDNDKVVNTYCRTRKDNTMTHTPGNTASAHVALVDPVDSCTLGWKKNGKFEKKDQCAITSENLHANKSNVRQQRLRITGLASYMAGDYSYHSRSSRVSLTQFNQKVLPARIYKCIIRRKVSKYYGIGHHEMCVCIYWAQNQIIE